jgi:NADH dehydrogenase
MSVDQSSFDATESPKKTIAIVGAGFAGTALVRGLEKKTPTDWRILLISEESYTTFNPMLAEVVGAGIFPEHVIAPVREMIRGTQFIMARVVRVDVTQRVLSCETLAGVQDIAYDHLVLACGQRANMDIVPGMAEHALPLKLVGDAMFIRNRILQRLATIEITADQDQRRRTGHFVVVGGGFSGVEVAGVGRAFKGFAAVLTRCGLALAGIAAVTAIDMTVAITVILTRVIGL